MVELRGRGDVSACPLHLLGFSRVQRVKWAREEGRGSGVSRGVPRTFWRDKTTRSRRVGMLGRDSDDGSWHGGGVG